MPKDRFLTAAEIWKRCRTGTLDPESAGIAHSGLYGLWFVAGTLVRDMAALNLVEMLPWDVWGAQPEPSPDMTRDQLEYFDGLAELLIKPDRHIDRIMARYNGDARLKVSSDVYNALLQRRERLEPHGVR